MGCLAYCRAGAVSPQPQPIAEVLSMWMRPHNVRVNRAPLAGVSCTTGLDIVYLLATTCANTIRPSSRLRR